MFSCSVLIYWVIKYVESLERVDLVDGHHRFTDSVIHQLSAMGLLASHSGVEIIPLFFTYLPFSAHSTTKKKKKSMRNFIKILMNLKMIKNNNLETIQASIFPQNNTTSVAIKVLTLHLDSP